MKDRSIYNMIISIITAVLVIPFLVLGIIHHTMNHNTLTVILLSIYYPLMIIYFILKSIGYGMEEERNKEGINRVAKSFLDVVILLIIINFTLLLATPIKWIIFGGVIALTILEIIIDSCNKLIEIKYLLDLIKAFIFIFILIHLYKINGIVGMASLSITILYFSSLLGNLLNNKIILSFDLLSMTLFGLFLIFI
mgnify:CR=1 FL=1